MLGLTINEHGCYSWKENYFFVQCYNAHFISLWLTRWVSDQNFLILPNFDYYYHQYLKRENVVCPLTLSNKKPKCLLNISFGPLVILKNDTRKKTRLRTIHYRNHLKIRGVFEDKFINSCFSFCKISRKDPNINFHIPNRHKSSHKKYGT